MSIVFLDLLCVRARLVYRCCAAAAELEFVKLLRTSLHILGDCATCFAESSLVFLWCSPENEMWGPSVTDV